ncbi:MAG: hypothetical protein V4662_17760 [Verrucomicrobiota bacterium]
MSPANRPLLIICLLRQLHEVHSRTLRLVDLTIGANSMGFPGIKTEEVSSALTDCVQQGYVIETRDAFDKSIKRYARTDEARVALVDAGEI